VIRTGRAVEGLKAKAYCDARVERIIAETLPDLEPSIGVLRKTGFSPVDGGSEPGVVRFEHRRAEGGRTRPET
jgi:hypothetical protein